MYNNNEKTLPPMASIQVTTRWGLRIFTLTTNDGQRARVIDPFTGLYAITFGKDNWRTRTPPQSLFGGA